MAEGEVPACVGCTSGCVGVPFIFEGLTSDAGESSARSVFASGSALCDHVLEESREELWRFCGPS